VKPERWGQIDKLFQAALALDPADRSAFLDHACKGDESLKKEVESLIASHDSAGSFMSSPAIEANPSLIATDDTDSIFKQPVGPYSILSLLGAGGMGEVYLAVDTRLGRKVALKLLPDLFTRDEQRVLRFQQEARAASALNHPNIITIHDIGESAGRHFIATEFVDGETLRQRMAGGRMSLAESLDIAAQVASALSTAHQAGIIHRDIKPENIMLRPDGLVKVLDFGLAKLGGGQTITSGTQATIMARVDTEPGTVMGTANYMSPEQARGQAVDGRTDIFSLGAVVYEMVAGKPPFEAESTSDVIAAILVKDPAPLARYEPESPAELQRIVTKALAKDREERYQTVKDFLIDLRNLKEGLTSEARTEEVGGPGATSEPAAINTAKQEAVRLTSRAGYLAAGGKRHKSIAAVALAALVIAAVALIYFNRGGGQKPIDSLAVLPFVNGSDDPNAEYLSDGITEAIIYNLSQLPNLRVMSLSSVSSYKVRDPQGELPNPQEAGTNLNVRAVLVGKVAQRGDSLSITVELVDALDNRVLWGQQYNRKMTDILAMQQDISREITDRLRLRLSGEEQRQLARSYTDNPEAYRLYLLGRYFWNKRTGEAVNKGIEYFEQATRLDPGYALAYSGLADSYYNLAGVDSSQPPLPYFLKARDAAVKAVELDDGLAEAHTSLGAVREWFEWDMAAAEREYRRALELNPGYATGHHRYGVFLAFSGRLDEALAEFNRALQIEPISLIINNDLAMVYYFMGDYDRAIEQAKRTIEIDPTFHRTYGALAAHYTAKKMYDEAIAELQERHPIPDGYMTKLALGRVYAKSGRRAEAMKLLGEIEALSRRRYLPPGGVAGLYAALGYKDRALALVERGIVERSWFIRRIAVDPADAELRSDPRVLDLLRRAGVVQ
jgi:serine/threonine-protein kinase